MLLTLPIRLYNKLYDKVWYSRLHKKLEFLGENATIAHPATITGHEYVSIGKDTHINAYSRIQVYPDMSGGGKVPHIKIGENCSILFHFSVLAAADIVIGDNVLIASHVFISSHNHGMDAEGEKYVKQPLICAPVEIGDEVWLGEKVCILPGVSIGKRSIIAAGSVVTKSVPAYSIAAGNPARVIKKWNFETKSWDRV